MLLQKNIVKKYLAQLDDHKVQTAWTQYQQYFLNKDIQQNIRQSKEEQFQEGFLRELFVKVMGYTLNPSPGYNLITEKKNETNAKKADGAIEKDGTVIGVIELKDHKTTDLSKVEPQAFNYKSQHPQARLVIISNFEKLRLYIDNAVEHREWDLFRLTEDDFRELYLCLAWTQVERGVALQMKTESVSSEDQITKALYRDYSQFKRVLFADILAQNPYDGTQVSHLRSAAGAAGETPAYQDEKDWQLLLFKKTQKLLDRLLFIFFAEDCGLLPPNSMVQIIDQWEMLKEVDAYVPFYDRVKKYFGYMNTGFQGKNYEIFAYNGGLFKPDEVLDNIKITDELLVEHTKRLSTYDFESDVDVNILGHIFENSLSEIEEVTQQISNGNIGTQASRLRPAAGAAGETPAYQSAAGETPAYQHPSKRKQDGVFYTPQYITKYIVEQTVGRLCAEKKRELGIEDFGTQVSHLRSAAGAAGGTPAYQQRRQMQTKKRLLDQLSAYREWLLQITILDPACGSGAFLNAALQFLMAEHKLIDEMEAKITGSAIVFQDVENSILEHNLYGVDINEESVEIAQLALWLRTAKPHRKLNTLSENIKCGNSLISDPSVAGSKAFDWQKEFPQVFGTQVSHLRHPASDGTQVSHLRQIGTQVSHLRQIGTQVSHLRHPASETLAYQMPENHCRKYLPHIENQSLQFITFRLYDSLPQEVIERLKTYKDSLTCEKKDDEQVRRMLELLDKYEDAGYGQCFLMDERIARIVQDALLHFHGKRYELIQWCIMPNHVHVLIRVEPGVSLSTIMHSWRTFTAHEANKVLGRTGQFWMREYFDRYIRDADHFNKTVNYIRNNPVKAGLTTDPDQWPWTGDGSSIGTGNGTQASRLRPAAGAAGETPAYQGGFDVVIGNPPYVHLESIIETSKQLEQVGFETYNKRGDMYVLFVEQAFRLAKPGGMVSYIMPNKWLQAGYGKELRAFLLTKRLERLIDFGDIQIFEGATTYPCIFIGSQSEPASELKVSVLNAANASDFNQNVLATEEIFDYSQFTSDTWVISSRKEKAFIERLSSSFSSLKQFVGGEAYYGIKTGLSEAFLIDSTTRRQLVDADPHAAEHIVPFLQGRHITPYGKAEAASYLILFEKGWTQSRQDFQNEAEAWAYLHKAYPSIASWLEPFAEKGRKRTDKGDYWWELRACEYYDMFAKPKIMYQAFQVKPCFIYDEEGFYSNNSMWFIPTQSKSLLAILNSKMGWWLITKFCTQIQNGCQLIWKYFGQIPIANAGVDTELCALADTMLTLNRQLQEKRSRFLRRLSDNFPVGGGTQASRLRSAAEAAGETPAYQGLRSAAGETPAYQGVKVTTALQSFDLLDFKGFLAELKKQKIRLSPKEQDEWEDYFNQYCQVCQQLSEQIKATDSEIDRRVFDLYGLTDEERKIVIGTRR